MGPGIVHGRPTENAERDHHLGAGQRLFGDVDRHAAAIEGGRQIVTARTVDADRPRTEYLANDRREPIDAARRRRDRWGGVERSWTLRDLSSSSRYFRRRSSSSSRSRDAPVQMVDLDISRQDPLVEAAQQRGHRTARRARRRHRLVYHPEFSYSFARPQHAAGEVAVAVDRLGDGHDAATGQRHLDEELPVLVSDPVVFVEAADLLEHGLADEHARAPEHVHDRGQRHRPAEENPDPVESWGRGMSSWSPSIVSNAHLTASASAESAAVTSAETYSGRRQVVVVQEGEVLPVARAHPGVPRRAEIAVLLADDRQRPALRHRVEPSSASSEASRALPSSTTTISTLG